MSRYSARTAEQLARHMAPDDAAVFLAHQQRDPHAVAAGSLARDAGSALEAWLEGQHEAAWGLGLAYVRHVGAPCRVGPDGQPTRWIGAGPADYQGTLAGGRSLAIEAKSREVRLSRREIPEHQQEDLRRVHALGGLALLVVELRTEGTAPQRFAVPWSEVPWRRLVRVTEGRTKITETVGAEELRSWRCLSPCYLGRWAHA